MSLKVSTTTSTSTDSQTPAQPTPTTFTYNDETIGLVPLSDPVLNPPDTPLDPVQGLSKYVIDCRLSTHDNCVKNVGLVAELLLRDEVVQVWYNMEERSHFLELRGRLTKSIKRKANQDDLEPDLFIRKITCHDQDMSPGQACDIGTTIFQLFRGLSILPSVARSHCGLIREIMLRCKEVKKMGKSSATLSSNVNSDRNEVSRKKCSSSYEDNRRPGKRTFQALKAFYENDSPSSKKPRHKAKESPPLKGHPQKHCYMCKKATKPRGYGDVKCSSCLKINEAMRVKTIDLRGRYAIVTGARVKIGYEITLRLLRNGCFVLGTSRFPCDALHRFEQEKDFESFKDRLRMCSLDFENMSSVAAFLKYAKDTLPHLDILINNAAQTIYRPPKYYESLQAKEQTLSQTLNSDKHMIGVLNNTHPPRCVQWVDEENNHHHPLTSADANFPRDLVDEHGQQIDLRNRNSWTLNLSEVPIQELLQVLAINTVGPFLLTARLKPLLLKSPNARKFVVNVSAMEGQFSRITKGHRHPHTNMAKAALNMMTRTSGLEFQMDGIYMTAVDTGWVTDERPFQQSTYEKESNDFVVPLDCEDGAARVLHPIFDGISNADKVPYFSVFLKDFKVHPW